MYISEKYHTAKGWYNRGYLIRWGAKSHIRDTSGRPLFARSQVRPKPYYYREY